MRVPRASTVTCRTVLKLTLAQLAPNTRTWTRWYLEATERETAALVAEAQAASPGTLVPGCPGWRVVDVGVHLGVVHRCVTEMGLSGATDRLADRDGRFAVDPDDLGLAEWLRTGASELVAALSACPPERAVRSWMPGTTAAFWRRRMAHESAVHRCSSAGSSSWTPIRPAGFPGLGRDVRPYRR